MTLAEKAKRIRLVIFDVDGVLTDGKLHYGSDGTEHKSFNVHDGLGMKLLQKSGIEIAIITAKRSNMVEQRMTELGIQHIYQGVSHKLTAYEHLKQKLSLTDDVIAYVGDDLPDLAVLKRVGLSITVANAPSIIQQHADWVTKLAGGMGAAREVSDFILQAQGTYETVIQDYVGKPL
jgi:3-deoxy-D-manno-octulosonate 8-phosphate phosphatase (KDO 8-P phosphatase)